MENEIRSGKILIKEIFSNMWFRIPEYQRPYVWSDDEIHDLLDDLNFAMINKPDNEYFLGSFVFQSKKANPSIGQQFDENDLLDGQQRMTTIMLLFAVLRDMTADHEAKDDCQKCIYQKSSRYKNIPERTRLVFSIRESVQNFCEKIIKINGGTDDEDSLRKLANENDVNIKNISNAILYIREFLTKEKIDIEEFLGFLLNNVMLIYVSTENMEDAFRLFTILNDRGVPLRNSDILKSINLGELDNQKDNYKYAKLWEDAEGELGDEFDRFLNHLRSVLVKEKARLNLLQEFESKIYNPKEKDKKSGKFKPPLLQKGKATFNFIESYLNIYKTLFSGNNYEIENSFIIDNLLKVMIVGLPATDWIPPLLLFYNKFGSENLLSFLIKLDNKFSSDWISQYSPTYRIDSMNEISKVIEAEDVFDNLINHECFDIDKDSFIRVLEDNIYGRRFARYILLKLDYYFQNHDQKMHFETLSVEHILPQTPKENSNWISDFTEDERSACTHKIGNLVLITRRKNTSQGRLDYHEKKTKYFSKNIDTCPNSLRVLNTYSQWTKAELNENQIYVLEKIKENYSI